jgi:hypothetical protein
VPRYWLARSKVPRTGLLGCCSVNVDGGERGGQVGGPECTKAEEHCNGVDSQGNRARRQIAQVSSSVPLFPASRDRKRSRSIGKFGGQASVSRPKPGRSDSLTALTGVFPLGFKCLLLCGVSLLWMSTHLTVRHRAGQWLRMRTFESAAELPCVMSDPEWSLHLQILHAGRPRGKDLQHPGVWEVGCGTASQLLGYSPNAWRGSEFRRFSVGTAVLH